MSFKVILNQDKEDEIDITDYVTDFELQEDAGNKLGDLEVDTTLNLFQDHEVKTGTDISLFFNTDDRRFYGIIDEVEKKETGTILAKDRADQLRNREVIDIWRNRTPSYIVRKIVNNYSDMSDEGIQLIEPSEYEIEKYIADKDRAIDIVKDMAEIMDWNWYANEDVFYFEPKGETRNETVLEIDENCTQIGRWNEDKHSLVNDLTVEGDERTYGEEETFTGDGSTEEFKLDYRPVSIKVWVDGTLQKGDVEEQVEDADYSVDKEARTINFINAPSNGSTIEVNYDYSIPIQININNPGSKEEYGEHDKDITRKRLKTRQDARNFAESYLNYYSTPSLSGELHTYLKDIHAGESIRVIDPIHDIDKWFIVNEVTYNLNDQDIELKIGEPEFDYWIREREEILKRIEELEKEVTSESDLMQYIRMFTEDFEVKISQVQHKIEKREGASSAFILGNQDDDSELGTAVLGRSYSAIYGQKETQYGDPLTEYGADYRTPWEVRVNET